MPETIELSQLAALDVDIEGVRAAATAMQAPAVGVIDDGARTVRAWRQSEAYYIAPESQRLVAALDPVGPTTQRVGNRAAGVARALTAYADQAEPLIAQLRRLRAVGDTGSDPKAAARFNALMAELLAVEQACAAAIRAQTGPDLVPPRFIVSERVETAGGEITIGFFTLGQGTTFKITTFSDKTVHLTALNDGAVGATGGVGGLVDLGAGLKVESGSTWRFRDMAEADRFRQQIQDYVAQQNAIMHDSTGGAAFAVALTGGVPEPRRPDLLITEFGAEANGTVKPENGIFSANGEATGELKNTVVRDLTTGAETTTFVREGTGGLSGTAKPGPASASGDESMLLGSATSVTRDANGQIVRVTLTTTEEMKSGESLGGEAYRGSEGNHAAKSPAHAGYTREQSESDVVVTTATLPVGAAERAVVEQWVTAESTDLAGAADDGPTYRPVSPVPGDAFQNLMHERATVTEVHHHNVSDIHKIDAEAKLGAKFGFEVSSEVTESTTDRATYLGRPGPDGLRAPVRVR